MTSDNATAQGMPLFYRRPEALSPARHGTISMIDRPGFEFAAGSHAVPLLANEMPMAMRSYPIVFVGPQKSPVAITGLRRDENLFVGSEGVWAEPHYVPAYVRRYPFVFSSDGGTGRLTLCVDMASDRLIETSTVPLDDTDRNTSPLFDGSEPSAATRKALEFCEQFQQAVVVTQGMVQLIDRLNLFAERRSTVTLESGEVLNLTDFQVIDEAAVNALSDEDFLRLRTSGALALVYCHFASMNSWPSLVHQARLRRSA